MLLPSYLCCERVVKRMSGRREKYCKRKVIEERIIILESVEDKTFFVFVVENSNNVKF